MEELQPSKLRMKVQVFLRARPRRSMDRTRVYETLNLSSSLSEDTKFYALLIQLEEMLFSKQ